MSKAIVYKNNDNKAMAIIPFFNCGLTIKQTASKDVPKGLSYKIIDSSELPSDYTFYAAWEVDLSNPDGIRADYGAGSTNAVTGWNTDGIPV